MKKNQKKLRIYSIFKSIDGEVNHFHQGRISTFIRFAGCNLNCSYCDTKYALKKSSGKEISVNQIMKKIKELECKNITITGGEPLMQFDGFLELTKALWGDDYKVSVETNGCYFPHGINVGCWVVDYKLSNSGVDKNLMMELIQWKELRECDFVKFVISTTQDFNEACKIMQEMKEVGCLATFAFSPAHDILSPHFLLAWLEMAEINDVVVNLQLHKYLNLIEDQ